MQMRKGKGREPSRRDALPERLPGIQLHHGSAMWLLAQLGFRGAASESTFYEYIKSLRKLGIPFERGEIGLARRGLAIYSYDHLMEIALGLTLRVYHVIPDSVLAGIIRYRGLLYRHYRRAYTDRHSGIGAPVVAEVDGHATINMRGMFLDLQIDFSGGKLVRFGPPNALSPAEALAIYAGRDLAARAFLPLNLSLLSERVVTLSLRARLIRRGPRSNLEEPARRKQ
jgi:hypothetical protein